MGKIKKAIKQTVSVLAVAGLIAGCATAAQRQYQTMASNIQSASQKLQACSQAEYNSAEYEPLRKHIPLSINHATLEQLADRNLVSDEEIKVIFETHPKFQSCRQEFLDQISQTAPTMGPIFVITWSKHEISLVDLIQRKQSWGDHLKRVKEAANEGLAQIATENQRIMAGLNQSHEAELSRRQVAADAFRQYNQTQQVINSMNRSVNCTSNRVGNQTFTNCY